eukprot:8302855-Ditylum_brightwellii.AAC.1
MITNFVWLLMIVRAVQGSKIQFILTRLQTMGGDKGCLTHFHRRCPKMRRPTDSNDTSYYDIKSEN